MENNSLNWKKFSTKEFEIMLPGSFIGGDPKKDKKEIEAKIAELPEKYRAVFKSLFNGKNCPFFAVDTNINESDPIITVVNTSFDKLPLFSFGMTMEKYLQEGLGRLGKNVEIVEKGVVALQNYQAARVVINNREKGGLFKKPGEIQQIIVFFSIKLKTKFWDFFFATTPARFEKELPIFEQSMHSILFYE